LNRSIHAAYAARFALFSRNDLRTKYYRFIGLFAAFLIFLNSALDSRAHATNNELLKEYRTPAPGMWEFVGRLKQRPLA
jgi:hypothetical protein